MAILALACSEAKPTIDQTMAMRSIQLDAKTSVVSQQLVFLAAIQYKDGVKNLQNLYVLNDNLQILWQINANQLQSIVYAGKTWVGSTRLVPAPGEPVPNGRFRLVLNDRSGNSVKAEATLPRPEGDPAALVPRVIRQADKLTVSPTLRPGTMQRELVIKDWSGAEVGRFAVQADQFSLAAVMPTRNPADLACYLTDSYPDEGLLLSSGPW